MRLTISIALSTLLGLGGSIVPTTAIAGSAQTAGQSRRSLLEARMDALELAMAFANEAPVSGEQRLRNALESLHGFAPEIAANSSYQSKQQDALLTLARALVQNGRVAQARMTLRELFRVDPPRTSKLERFGPTLTELAVQERSLVESLDSGQVRVNCASPCELYLNERKSRLDRSVPTGEYRLYLRDKSDKTPPLRRQIEIRDAGGQVRVHFDNPLPQAPPIVVLKRPAPPTEGALAPRLPNERIAPRWLEISGLSVGGLALAAGAFLVIKKDVNCFKKNQQGECDYDLDLRKAGIPTLAIGGALFATSLALFVIDERTNKKKAKTSRSLSSLLRGQWYF